MTPNPTTEDPLTRLLATINRRSEQQRKHHEDQKLAALRRKPWWLDADNHRTRQPRSRQPRTRHPNTMKRPPITPGPWTATDTTTEIYNAVGDKIGEGIKVCFDGSDHRWHVADVYGQREMSRPLTTRHGYAEANARAIAALPCILDAVQRTIERWTDDPDDLETMDKGIEELKAALLKAGYTP